MKESVSKNYLFSLLYQMINVILQVVTLPYLVRVIGTDGVGIQSYTNSIVSIFSIIGVLGINWYGQRNIAKVMDYEEGKTKLFWELAILKIINCLVVLIFYIIFAFYNKKYTIFAFAQIFLYFGNMLDISWFFQGIEKFKSVAIRNSLVKIIGITLVFLFVKEKNDVLMYILILSVTTFLGNVVLWLKLKNELIHIDFKTLNIKQHLKQVVYYFVPTIATSVYLLMDKAMIGIFTKGSSQNGYYEQAIQILNMIKTLFLSYNSVMVSRMTFLYKNKKHQEYTNELLKSKHLFSYLSWALFLGLISVSDEFVNLYYGDHNDLTTYILYAFSSSIIFVSVSSMIESHIITPMNLRQKGNIIVSFGAVVNFVLNLFLIPYVGSLGAGIASTIAEGVIALGYVIVCMRIFSITSMLKIAYKKILSSFVMFAVIINIQTDSMISAIFLKVTLGFLIYNAVLILLKDEFVLKAMKMRKD